MTTRSSDANRVFGLGNVTAYAIIASTIIYAGSAVGQVKASGHIRPLTAVDKFVGFAQRQINNSAGAAGLISGNIERRGQVKLEVAGAVITDPVGTPVYATDDDAFSFSPVGGVFIGVLARWESAGVIMVDFDIDKLVDPHAGLLAELASTSITTDVQDTGKLIVCDTTVVHTLGATAVGGRVRFLNVGPFGTVQISLSPNASDKVQGPNLGGMDNKDLINTLATAQRGDYVELLFGQTDGPVVTVMRGVWATEG